MWVPSSPFVSLQHRELRWPDQPHAETQIHLDFLDFSSGSASPCSVSGMSQTIVLLNSQASKHVVLPSQLVIACRKTICEA